MTFVLYGKALANTYDGTANATWNWLTDTIKVEMTTATYSPNVDTDAFLSAVTNEVTGTAYTAGGVTLASKTVTYDSATDQVRFDSADPQWASSTIANARRAVIYKSTGTASTSPLIGVESFATDQSTSGGLFQITVDAIGWFYIDCT